MAKLFEADDYILITVIILFLLINFNEQFGTVYLGMAVIDWVAYYIALDSSAFKLLPVERLKQSRWLNIVWAMGAFVAFSFINSFLLSRFAGVDTTSIFDIIGSAFSSTPILYGSTYVKLLVWGILIPIVETKLFFRTLVQWGSRAAGSTLPNNVFTVRAHMISGFFGAVFTVFHIVAKGITNNTSLFTTFVFGYISVLLVIHFQEAIQAIMLHIITNTISVMNELRIGFFSQGSFNFSMEGVYITAGVIVATWLLLFQELPLIGAIPRVI